MYLFCSSGSVLQHMSIREKEEMHINNGGEDI